MKAMNQNFFNNESEIWPSNSYKSCPLFVYFYNTLNFDWTGDDKNKGKYVHIETTVIRVTLFSKLIQQLIPPMTTFYGRFTLK